MNSCTRAAVYGSMGMIQQLIFVLWLLVALSVAACGVRVERDSEHFHFIFEPEAVSDELIALSIPYAEALFERISAIVGPENTPQEPITIIFGGAVTAEQYPRLDKQWRILLYRYSAARGGYLGPLAHEMAHAFRPAYWMSYDPGDWDAFDFCEEGFAEFIAMTVSADKTCFPFYGYPEDVVAGYWVTSGQAIPLQTLRDRHQELNMRCQNQSYTQRASWFRFIDQVYGRAIVLRIAYSEVELDAAEVLSIFGKGLAEVDEEWEQWLSDRYAAIPNAQSLSQAYRQRVSQSRICVAGVEF